MKTNASWLNSGCVHILQRCQSQTNGDTNVTGTSNIRIETLQRPMNGELLSCHKRPNWSLASCCCYAYDWRNNIFHPLMRDHLHALSANEVFWYSKISDIEPLRSRPWASCRDGGHDMTTVAQVSSDPDQQHTIHARQTHFATQRWKERPRGQRTRLRSRKDKAYRGTNFLLCLLTQHELRCLLYSLNNYIWYGHSASAAMSKNSTERFNVSLWCW